MKNDNLPVYKKWWVWILGILLLIGMFSGINSNNNTTNSNNTTTNIENISANETTNNEEVVFLSNTNGEEFYSILCEVAGVNIIDGVTMGDTIDYTSGNEDYGIELETNKDGEINWISIYTMLPNNYENFFLAISRLEYNGSNRNQCFNWINDNLGKEATTKIGDANFKLYNGTSGNPVLEVYTDGNEQFQKEQLDKLNN
ncbi:MAG: hypothetical protein IKG42_04755 [Clostridia bacterium]|nr:hypothetical protein [Clostridia bacterium]